MAALIRRFHEAKEVNADSVTCWGTGTPLREFLHVDDLGEACVHTLKGYHSDPSEPIQHLNVGTGIDLTIKELAETVACVVGFRGEILWDESKPDGTPKKQLDVSRLAALGWHAKISLQQGLRKTYDDFAHNYQSKSTV